MRRPSRFLLAAAGFLMTACAGEAAEEAAPEQTAAGETDALSCYIARGTMAEAQQRPSPLTETRFSVGGSDALLCYGAPSARGREIMGGLVVFGQLERIGANEPTTLHLAGPASVGGVALQPGSYSIYAIPGPDEWQVFVNTSWERWGIPIDEGVRAGEVGSFTVVPEETDEFVETLRYTWENGALVMEWENTRVRIPVTGA